MWSDFMVADLASSISLWGEKEEMALDGILSTLGTASYM